LYPERYRGNACPVCKGRREVFEPAQMMDEAGSHSHFKREWEELRAKRESAGGGLRGACVSTLKSFQIYGRAFVRKEFGLEGDAAERKVHEIQEELRGWILKLD